MLTLSHVSKRFGKIQVLHNLCIYVPEHTIYAAAASADPGERRCPEAVVLSIRPADQNICRRAEQEP